jgi:hypothetical protein
MDEIIYSASCFLSYLAYMDEVFNNDPLALESMAEISHSTSGPPAKGSEYLSFLDRNTYLFCCIVAFAALLLFNAHTYFPC